MPQLKFSKLKELLGTRAASLFFSSLLVIWAIVLVIGTLQPFRFTADPVLLSKRAEPVEWVPCTYVCPVCGMRGWVKDKVVNLLMFLPFGVLASLRQGHDERQPRLGRTVLWGFLLSFAIEFAQYFIPVRMPSASDLLFNTLGAWAGGWLGWRWLRRLRPASPPPPKVLTRGVPNVEELKTSPDE